MLKKFAAIKLKHSEGFPLVDEIFICYSEAAALRKCHALILPSYSRNGGYAAVQEHITEQLLNDGYWIDFDTETAVCFVTHIEEA
jgi:hypothetical protein